MLQHSHNHLILAAARKAAEGVEAFVQWLGCCASLLTDKQQALALGSIKTETSLRMNV